MKKVFYIVLCAAAVFAACSKEEKLSSVDTPAKAGKTSITVGIDEGQQTRTNLTGTKTLVWSSGDALSINTDSGFKTFTLEGEGGSATGTFSVDEEVIISSGANSFYPATMDPNWTDDAWHVTLPSEYAWSDTGIKAPMYAWLNNSYDYFSLMTSAIKVDFYNIPSAACKLVFTAKAETVSGDYVFPGACIPVVTGDSNKSITITFNAGTAESMTFFIPVPYGTYTAGATFVLMDSSDNALVTKTTPSDIAVSSASVSYFPAINCGGSLSTVLWEGSKEFTDWANWDAVPTYAITGLWSTFSAGDVLTLTLEDAGDVWLTMCYKDSDWSWVKFVDEAVSSGTTTYTHTLTADDITNLSIRNCLVISTKNVTITKIEVVDNRPETVLWRGSLDLGTDDSWDNNLTDLTASMWSAAKSGKVLTVYYTEKDQTNTWHPLQLQYMGDPWTTFANGGHNADGTSFFAYTLTADDVTNLKTYGLAINGPGHVITKVTLK